METQFVTDAEGRRIAVILPIQVYEKMLEELEELHDVQRCDEAKKEDDGVRILFSEYLKKRKSTLINLGIGQRSQ
jgi:hypothetical protein